MYLKVAYGEYTTACHYDMQIFLNFVLYAASSLLKLKFKINSFLALGLDIDKEDTLNLQTKIGKNDQNHDTLLLDALDGYIRTRYNIHFFNSYIPTLHVDLQRKNHVICHATKYMRQVQM